jgi:hypothetical protein
MAGEFLKNGPQEKIGAKAPSCFGSNFVPAAWGRRRRECIPRRLPGLRSHPHQSIGEVLWHATKRTFAITCTLYHKIFSPVKKIIYHIS